MSQKFRDSVFAMIKSSPVATDSIRKYVYSDLHFYFYPELIQRITGQKWKIILRVCIPRWAFIIFYTIRTLTYRIVPTEWDSLFRKTLIQGNVHDEGSALIGGVSGHAGLFGTANDLANSSNYFFRKENMVKFNTSIQTSFLNGQNINSLKIRSEGALALTRKTLINIHKMDLHYFPKTVMAIQVLPETYFGVIQNTV